MRRLLSTTLLSLVCLTPHLPASPDDANDTPRYGPGPPVYIHITGFEITDPNETPRAITLTDALGDPIAGAAVTVDVSTGDSSPRPLTQITSDNNGLVNLPTLDGPHHLFHLHVSHPDYGKALVRRYGRSSRDIVVPLVRRGSPAWAGAIFGQIVDTEGHPVADAVIECASIRTLGQGLIQSSALDYIAAVSDSKGLYNLYLPNEDDKNQRGDLIPLGSTYHIRITPPPGKVCCPQVEAVRCGVNTQITLGRDQHPREFLFESASGVIENRAELERIHLSIDSPRHQRLNLSYRDITTYKTFPNGTYKATIGDPTDEMEFEPVTVGEDSPETIRLTLKEPVTFRGIVLNSATGDPLPDACIIGLRGTVSQKSILDITDEQWLALEDIPADASSDNPALTPLRSVYSFDWITRSDNRGRFSLSFIPGAVHSLCAFKKDFTVASTRPLGYIKSDPNGVDLKPLVLVPAAAVSVEVRVDAEHLAVMPHYELDRAVRTQMKDIPVPDSFGSWIPINKPTRFYVPADIPLKVRIESPYDDRYSPLTVESVINAAQGEHIDLGVLQLSPALPVTVKVVNSQGIAVEGVPVRILRNGTGSTARNSDQQGLTHFHVPENTSGAFYISCHSPTGGFLKEELPFEIKGPEDADRQFTLTVPDKILKALFNP